MEQPAGSSELSRDQILICGFPPRARAHTLHPTRSTHLQATFTYESSHAHHAPHMPPTQAPIHKPTAHTRTHSCSTPTHVCFTHVHNSQRTPLTNAHLQLTFLLLPQDMKWIEEKQALYRRNQELVDKVCPLFPSVSLCCPGPALQLPTDTTVWVRAMSSPRPHGTVPQRVHRGHWSFCFCPHDGSVLASPVSPEGWLSFWHGELLQSTGPTQVPSETCTRAQSSFEAWNKAEEV